MLRKPVISALVVATVMGALLADGAAARSRPADPDRPVAVAAAAGRVGPGFSRERLHVVLRDGTDVRLRNGSLVSVHGTADTTELDAVLAATPGLRVERLYALTEARLDALEADGERRTGSDLPDLNATFRLVLPAGTDIDAVLDDLRTVDLVAEAYAEPLMAAPPTGDYSGRQTYGAAAPDGINVAAAARLPGGTGANVRIIDIEQGWDFYHEDLSKARTAFIANGTPVLSYPDHGTAVVGQMVGDRNGFGVTGLAPDAQLGLINAFHSGGDGIANAILLAADVLRPGDVVLIEQHRRGPYSTTDPNSQFGFLPVEMWLPSYNAIRTAVGRGIIVIEAAGNGYQNLDAAIYRTSPFTGALADSGAIMVGAGHAPGCGAGLAHSRMDYSNHGARVDVHAWGECVTTTGYGDLWNGGANATYTWTFAGTSSASPIVASAAALLSSIIEQRTGVPATPAQVRALLKSTGTPQVTGTGALGGNIGPMPDLARAIAALPAAGSADTTAPVVGSPSQAASTAHVVSATNAVPTTISWSATDASGIGAYAVRVSTNGGAWTDVTLPTPTTRSIVLNLAPGTRYQFTVAARDGAGNWSGWKPGVAFTPTLVGETSTAIRWSAGWTRSAYAPAVGGAVTVSGTRGAWASLSFTGRSIAWIGTKATTRGQADLWLDGVYQGRVDLFRDGTLPRAIVFSKNVSTGVVHKLDIKVVGTTNRPKVDIDGFAILK